MRDVNRHSGLEPQDSRAKSHRLVSSFKDDENGSLGAISHEGSCLISGRYHDAGKQRRRADSVATWEA